MVPTRVVLLAALLLLASGPGHMIAGFTLVARPLSLARTTTTTTTGHRRTSPALFENKQELDDGVVELVDSSTEEQSTKKEGGAVPNNPLFISQGEIDPETLNPDLSDPKQARVIIYIIISLIPVLFLIPLDAVPPVQM